LACALTLLPTLQGYSPSRFLSPSFSAGPIQAASSSLSTFHRFLSAEDGSLYSSHYKIYKRQRRLFVQEVFSLSLLPIQRNPSLSFPQSTKAESCKKATPSIFRQNLSVQAKHFVESHDEVLKAQTQRRGCRSIDGVFGAAYKLTCFVPLYLLHHDHYPPPPYILPPSQQPETHPRAAGQSTQSTKSRNTQII
ncbi:hypothetical protein BT96DRAFT_975740, partial [Gymnopus androsaceus JB14]